VTAAAVTRDVLDRDASRLRLRARPNCVFQLPLRTCSPSTSPLKRGKVPLQRGAVYKAFEGACADLSLSERDDLAPAAVAAKLSKALANATIEL
jgi:hypothetical protein